MTNLGKECAEKPAHQRSLIRVIVARLQNCSVLKNISMNMKYHTARMRMAYGMRSFVLRIEHMNTIKPL